MLLQLKFIRGKVAVSVQVKTAAASLRLQEEEEEEPATPIRGLSAAIVATFPMNLLRRSRRKRLEAGKCVIKAP